MKHLNKLCAICILAQLGVFSVAAQASELIPENTSDTSINAFLDQYFSARECEFTNPKKTYNIQNITAQSNNMEISSSEMRSCLISKMEERLDLSIVSSETTYTVSNTRTENDYIYLDVYEWTNVEYTGNSGLVDVFGYGVDHNMVLENYNDTYSLISDTYDEGPLTGMSSSLSNEEFFELANSKYPDYNTEQTHPDGILSEAECYSTLSTSTYNPYKVAEYANKWVNPSANGGTTYTNSYNTSEYVTNGPDGDADCTNYVSQCMYAGGMKMDSTSDINGWWYDKTKLWSYVWFTATPHFKYFKSNRTAYNNVSNSSYIIPGNPVYYNWHNSSTNYDDFNHAAICVGYDSNGVPIVNSHSYDYYHVKWNYGYSDTRYGTVKITNDDVLNTPSGGATLVAKITYNAKLDTSSDVDCYKFVPTESRTYTMATRGDTDTYGKLCNAANTELASDDNSGTGNNFKISHKLQAGKTYYIYVSSSKSSKGFYGLKIV